MIHNLFPTPIYHENIGPMDQIAEAFVKNAEYPHEAAGHWHTDDKYILSKPPLKKIKSKIKEHVDIFTHEYLQISKKVDFEIQNSWGNRHIAGQWNSQHWHSNCVISGVYYMNVDDLSGPITFSKPHTHMNLFGPMIRFDLDCEFDDNEYFRDSFTIYPKTGDILMFPSHMQHYVSPSQSRSTRYTIAFNLFPRGIVGDGTCELNI